MYVHPINSVKCKQKYRQFSRFRAFTVQRINFYRVMSKVYQNHKLEIFKIFLVPGCFFYLDVRERPESIESPNWPQDYPAHLQCFWVLFAPEGERISLTIFETDIEDSEECSNDVLTVRFKHKIIKSPLEILKHFAFLD